MDYSRTKVPKKGGKPGYEGIPRGRNAAEADYETKLGRVKKNAASYNEYYRARKVIKKGGIVNPKITEMYENEGEYTQARVAFEVTTEDAKREIMILNVSSPESAKDMADVLEAELREIGKNPKHEVMESNGPFSGLGLGFIMDRYWVDAYSKRTGKPKPRLIK